MDGYLGILGGEKYGGEWYDGRSGLAGDEESGVNARGSIIAGQ